VHALMAGFPAGVGAADAEFAALAAADELLQGSLEAGERYLERAEREAASVPESRRAQARLLLEYVRLRVVGQGGDQQARAEQVRRTSSAE
jgi:LuxR family transcriptional regulator, maltose regulon positive regulatory protein